MGRVCRVVLEPKGLDVALQGGRLPKPRRGSGDEAPGVPPEAGHPRPQGPQPPRRRRHEVEAPRPAKRRPWRLGRGRLPGPRLRPPLRHRHCRPHLPPPRRRRARGISAGLRDSGGRGRARRGPGHYGRSSEAGERGGADGGGGRRGARTLRLPWRSPAAFPSGNRFDAYRISAPPTTPKRRTSQRLSISFARL